MGSKTTFPSTGEFPGFQPSTLPCLESWYPRFLLGGSSQFVLVDPSTCFPRPRDKTLESPRTPGALHALYRQPEALMSSPQKWQEVENQKKPSKFPVVFFTSRLFWWNMVFGRLHCVGIQWNGIWTWLYTWSSWGYRFIMSESFCREGAGSDSQCLEQEPGRQKEKTHILFKHM